MNFEEFHQDLHDKGFQIVCLNDYKFKGENHTFIAVQDKDGHGLHIEGLSRELSDIYEKLLMMIDDLLEK